MKIIKLLVIIIIALWYSPADLHAGWRYVSPMPHGRYWHDAILGKDGKIYVMGGVVFEVTDKKIIRKYNDGAYSNLVYDPRQDKWEYKEAVPGTIMGSHQCLIFNREKGEWNYIRTKSKFDKEEMTSWNEMPDKYKNYTGRIRYTRFDFQGAGVAVIRALDGKIWWMGGMVFPSFAKDFVLTYDPSSDAWEEVIRKKYKEGFGYAYIPGYHTIIPPMHEKRVAHEAVMTSDGKVYVMGGWRAVRNPSGPVRIEAMVTNTVECYDPKTKTWEYKSPLSTKRMLFAAVLGPDNKIFVFGGAAGDAANQSTPVLDTVEVYDPMTDTWAKRSSMPSPRKSHSAVQSSDGKIYILGGTNVTYGQPLREVYIYDPRSDTWEKCPDMQVPRASLAAVSTPDGKIYAIGGTDVGSHGVKKSANFLLPRELEFSEGKVQDTVEVLDISR